MSRKKSHFPSFMQPLTEPLASFFVEPPIQTKSGSNFILMPGAGQDLNGLQLLWRESSWCFACVSVSVFRALHPAQILPSSDLPIGRAEEVWKGSTVMMVVVMHHGSTVGSVLRVYRLEAGRVGFQGVMCGLSSRSRSDRGRIASLRWFRLLGTPGREEQLATLRYSEVKELSVLTSCRLPRRYKPPTNHPIFKLHLFTHHLFSASRSYWESASQSIVAVELGDPRIIFCLFCSWAPRQPCTSLQYRRQAPELKLHPGASYCHLSSSPQVVPSF